MKRLNVLQPASEPAGDSVGDRTPDPAGVAPSPPAETAGAARAKADAYWRSLEDRGRGPEEAAQAWREFPKGAESLELDGVSRRRFFQIMGSGAAVAGAAATSGCARKPIENILPFSERPEEMVPGQPLYYATAFQLGATVEGVLVESQDGRPTKIEGNPKHSSSLGRTGVFAQASILDLYDAERTRFPYRNGEPTDSATARGDLEDLLAMAERSGGQNLALCIGHVRSPIQRTQLARFRQRFPQARIFEDDPLAPRNAQAAAQMVGGDKAQFYYALDTANVVFAADADILSGETESTRMAREWAKGRRINGPTDTMSRLYVVEPHLTNTGVMADHRRRVRGSQVGDVLVALLREITSGKYDVQLPAGVELERLPAPELDAAVQEMVVVAAEDLASAPNLPDTRSDQPGAGKAPGHGVVVVGERQPPWVHGIGLLINAILRNTGSSVRWLRDALEVVVEPIEALPQALGSGIDTVICWGTNPVYHAPADLGLAEALSAATVVHFGLYRDETAQLASLHIPVSHYLEGWGDLEALDGTITICQPLIAPLHATYSMTEVLGYLATGKMIDGYSLVKGFWTQQMGPLFAERTWRKWVHDGVVTSAPTDPVQPILEFGKVMAAIQVGPRIEGFEVNFHTDPKLADGRFAANAWLQELPHPISKLTWDNAAYLAPATARELGVANSDMVDVTVDGRTLSLPAFIVPGQAEQTVSISLGYGRTRLGPVADGAGFNAYSIRPSTAPWFAPATLTKAGGTYPLASTQDYGSLKPPTHLGVDYPERPIVLEADYDAFREDPNFVEHVNLMKPSRLQHLWDPPKLSGRQQWGMSIDLNTCTGCSACVVACQAENNIPTVGKKQVQSGREMHWMRIDRYYRGDPDEPTAVVQPMLCQQCEAAPCETVCPVAATTHSPEGLNDMAYNRCIGTRYCSNNCPYKVRRYNFFNYNLGLRPGSFWTDDADGARLAQMQKNPDVTVRFRGVMEKCTYCVQRINGAKIEAHVAGEDVVADGQIVTACQQVCPTGAIVFGDIRDPDSAVSKAKRSPRDYEVLRDLNVHPRTTYLARIRNPHPKLAPAAAHDAEPAAAKHDSEGA